MTDPYDYDPIKDGEILVDTEPIEESEAWDDDEPNDEFMK